MSQQIRAYFSIAKKINHITANAIAESTHLYKLVIVMSCMKRTVSQGKCLLLLFMSG